MTQDTASIPASAASDDGTVEGKLALNVMYFARALRAAGLPVGTGAVHEAVAAVALAGFARRQDVQAALHATLVSRHEHTILFDQAFAAFWRRRGYLDKLMAALAPIAEPQAGKEPRKPEAGAARVAEALAKPKRTEQPTPTSEFSAHLTVSAQETLANKDFAQMSAAEVAEAARLVGKLTLPRDAIRVRRLTGDPRGRQIDLRGSFRRSMRAGGAGIELARRSPNETRPPIVAICDISGSMADYTRIFLHFLHALTARRRVHSFLFGTRLTNVTRALRAKDPDEALAGCGAGVVDWAGGTRIGQSLHRFNKDWSRRVLGQGAIVILFTDGLEREGLTELAREMDRLHRSCRRLIWVNPLLRFAGFEAKAGGVRTMLGHVDDFRPIHNLRAMADLCAALGSSPGTTADPKRWLRGAG